MNSDVVAKTLDQALAWHLKELAKLCPEGTRFTMVARIWRDGAPDDNAVLVIGDEPDAYVKGALFAGIRAINGVQSKATQHHLRAAGISSQRVAPILVGAEVVQEAPPGSFDPLNLNGGVIDVTGGVEQK